MRSGLVVFYILTTLSSSRITTFPGIILPLYSGLDKQGEDTFWLYKQSNTYVGHLEPQEVKRRQESVSTHNITWVTLEEQNMNTHCHKTLKCYKRTGWLSQIQLPKKHRH